MVDEKRKVELDDEGRRIDPDRDDTSDEQRNDEDLKPVTERDLVSEPQSEK